jgi:steroid 5-alpha reductase family enzyme
MSLPTLMLVSAAVIFGAMLALWLLSLKLRDSSIVDIAWGPIFVAVAAVGALLGDGWAGRQLLVLAMVGLWGLRLGWHIHRRNHGRGEDPRYAAWRREAGAAWWWRSLFKVFLLQGAVLWVVSLPIQLAMGLPGARAFTVWDAVGELVWAAGFLMEAIADAQLAAFRADPAKTGVLDDGLWRISRHPNYFGEAVLWWGIWLPALSVPGGWAAVVSPILITLLLRYVSGVPMAERLMEGRDGWTEYVRRVPIFVPGPSR